MRTKLFLELKGLDQASAVELILDAGEVYERDQQTDEQARKIAMVLDYHPLALTIASSLIRSAIFSIQECVDALGKRLMQKDVLSTESEQARYQTVSATFEVSAESLQRLASTDASAGSALALLDMLGFMHHHDVSEVMFVRAWNFEKVVLAEYGNDGGEKDGDIEHLSAWHVTQCQAGLSSSPPDERLRLFRKARAHLERLSLISVDQVAKNMSLHSMVHAWARDRVGHADEAWTAAASTLALSSEGDIAWRPSSSLLARQYESSFGLFQDIGSIQIEQRELCRILYAYAWQMYRASSVCTVSICTTLLQSTKELSRNPWEKLSVTEARYILAIAQQQDGQIREAVEMLEHVVKVREKLAEDHPSRLASQHALAGAYRANGQIDEAVEMLEHVVKVEEKLAEDHPSRLASQHALAGAYRANGQIDEAVEMLEHVVKVKAVSYTHLTLPTKRIV